MPLQDFVEQFKRAVIARRDQESDADFQSNFSRPILKISMNIEAEAAKFYPKEIFKFFQEELVNGLSYHHEKVTNSEDISTFLVWKKDKQTCRIVTFDHNSQDAKCDVLSIPPQYVMKRWTKDAKSGTVVTSQANTMLLKEVEIALKNVSLDVVGQIKEGENLQ
ncbi:protein FAR1-RELATED SEQUENCE 1-like [Elaeis guineensis]|uniref:protein FAR1-RELATED SEQUENCE 1-like n=1 Tax=Elaeis guineensis var. tenera TaxID=51953 RepID=UPI003C6DA34D